MKHHPLWSSAGLTLILTWLLFGMYYMTRFNFSPVIPLLKADLGISNVQEGGIMAFFFTTYTVFQLPGVLASPVGGFLSDRLFGGGRKPLIILGMAVLSGSSFLLSLRLSIAPAAVILAVFGLMILLPDVLPAAYPSDIMSRKLSATAMGFLATFTSAAGIITTPLSGKIADLFQSYGGVFFSFGGLALAGAILTIFINEKSNKLQVEPGM